MVCGLQRNKLPQIIAGALGRLAKLVSYTFVFFIPYWFMSGGLGETVVCFWYIFWWRVIESLLDSGVTTAKKTLLSFDTFPSDPERAVRPAQTRSLQGLPLVVNSVSCWVRSKMEEGGAGVTRDIVKVMSVDPVSLV